MIQNDVQLRQSLAAAVSLERSLEILEKDRTTINPDRYALMADPILDDLRSLKQSIEDYLSVHEVDILDTAHADSMETA